MLGQMPTTQVVAMLKVSGPAQAVGILTSMPADRMAALLAVMEPADLARILAAAPAVRRGELLAAVPAERIGALLRELPAPQVSELLSVVPAELAAQLLRGSPPQQAAQLLSTLPQQTRALLLDAMELDSADGLSLAVYEQEATEAVGRVSGRVSRLDRSGRDVLAEVFGRNVHVAVRYCATEASLGSAVYNAVAEANWRRVAGLVVVTNVALPDDAVALADNARGAGRPLELVRWIDARDDGAFKRALVRIAG